jgi:membrane-bound lytic murein transglycosylase D
VQAYIDLYAYRKREQVERMLGLSEYYFPMVEKVFKEYNIPTEFKYLAIVESALNPYAVSYVGATGMWQFMFTTAKMYNLEITSHVDERRDPFLATHAAAKYFVDMYRRYGDWLLVIAAYNCGPGNVNKAIRKAGGGKKTFWEIRQYLPQETRGYVPAYIAATYIMNCAESHNLYPTYPNFSFLTDTVHITRPVRFNDVNKLCGVNLEELKVLNPIFKKDFIPAYNQKYIIKVPATRKDLVASNIDSLYALFPNVSNETEFVLNTDPMAKSKVVYKTHVVKRGESLGRISSKYNVSVAEIKKWNNLKKSTIVAGQRIKIKKEIPAVQSSPIIAKNKKTTTTEEAQKVEATASNNIEAKEATTKVVYEYQVKNVTKKHKVKSGENLSLIANKYDVEVADIKKWNKLKSNKLMANQVLTIRKTESVRVAKTIPVKVTKPEETSAEAIASAKVEKVPERTEEETKFVFHKVEIGDTLWAIAKKYAGNTVENIKSLNGLKDNESLKAGMILKIPKKG